MCDSCNFSSHLNRVMKTHLLNKHQTVTAYNCTLCDYTAETSMNLNNHVLAQHMKNTVQVSLKKLITFHCNNCTYATTNKLSLNDHQHQAHPENPSNPVVFQCDLCPFKAKSSINLKRHSAMTHAKIKCDLCTFTSASQFHLFLHHENNHIVEQPISPPTTYPCDLCGMMFGHSDDLNAHIQRRHTHFETSPPSSQAQVPPNGQGFSLILEEQIDMAQTINSFKESVLAQLAEIKNNQ